MRAACEPQSCLWCLCVLTEPREWFSLWCHSSYPLVLGKLIVALKGKGGRHPALDSLPTSSHTHVLKNRYKTCSLKERREVGDFQHLKTFLRGNVHPSSLTTSAITACHPPQCHLGSVLCVLTWVWHILALARVPYHLLVQLWYPQAGVRV